MSDIKIVRSHAGERAEQAVTTGTKAWELFKDDAEVIAARVDGALKDLAYELADGDEVESVAIDSPDGHDILRHSTAHVMAQAVQDLFPDARLGIGPPIENGFYYDFDVETPFVPEDLDKIETRMRKIIKEGQRFSRRVTTDADAINELQEEPYKIELIGLKGGGASTGSTTEAVEGAAVEVGAGELTDLRQHPPRRRGRLERPVPRPAPAHHQADPGVQADAVGRGVLARRREQQAAAADLRHRLGVQGGARGTPAPDRGGRAPRPPQDGPRPRPVQLPRRDRLRPRRLPSQGRCDQAEMEDYVRQRHIEEGFEYVGTPHISKEGLFHTSGHLPYFADTMFPPIEIEGANYYLKAMNCPMHNLIYRSRGRSYRELPLRLFEFGSVYRFEKSGVVHGLTRVRGLTQDDSHSYCTPEQAADEVKHLLDFCLGLFRDFGLDDFYLELSTRDDAKDKFMGSDEQWAVATKVLEDAAADTGLELVPDPGGAAFYGPKISVQARDAIGRTWQMSTIQYDFNQPAGFELEYQAADGSRQQPVMIHSAKFGSLERFYGLLVEHYAGAFPPWLAPVQVQGIPIADRHNDYLSDVAQRMRAAGLRVEVDESDDRMQKKIRNAQVQKVPFMVIAGDQDMEAGAVSFRYRDGHQDNGVPIDEAIQRVVAAVDSREQV